ncbi:MAG: sulfate adenylyltransferase subunit CysN [Fibrobacterota bacterium]|nr:sulfate adenylyltransferase subunit CysN [Fibrobacterota bacterium]QQS04152.1 MAG: sulfate adenylyltransferase subunit CysN [Fibrobacterota bacterium]
MDLLRFSTAGSVDDGKSTLIGRLLYDSKGIFEDQLEAVQNASKQRLATGIDLSLLTDGLRAEREQGITIDVAYRYFATPKRKFIIADTPGHEQYTRNMATGASTADLAIVLIDARKGVLEQSRRHSAISAMLGIPRVCVAVNKMDLVDWSKDVFDKIRQDFLDLAAKLGLSNIEFIPLSALLGDNVVGRSENTPWYQGPTLIEHLETVDIPKELSFDKFRFPVQYVIRPDLTFRGFAGQIASGSVKPGDEIEVLPSGKRAIVKQLHFFDRELPTASFPKSLTITLDREVDVSRGDVIVKAGAGPKIGRDLDAQVVWMDERPLALTRPYFLKQGSRTVRARITRVLHRTEIKTLSEIPAANLGLNDIGRVRISAAHPILLDPYLEFRRTGAFILIDPETNATVAAGMVAADQPQSSTDVVWSESEVSRVSREVRNGHRGGVVWFTGLSGSGKSTIAKALEKRLFHDHRQVYLLDGDNLRHGLNKDLDFTPAARSENLRRAAETAKILVDAGFLVLATFISPTAADRDMVREVIGDRDFAEVHVSTPLAACESRDPKGLYARARSGEIREFTGISAPWEPPVSPALELAAHEISVTESVERVVALLEARGLFADVQEPGAGI